MQTRLGGPEETRTLDLSDANRTLSQLSYRPMGYSHIIARSEKIVKKKLAGFLNPWYTSRNRISKEALIKSARADSERFSSSRRVQKRRNTVCISRF